MDLALSLKKRIHNIRSVIVDPESNKLTEDQLKRASQLHADLPFMEDRRQETLAYYKLSEAELEAVIEEWKNAPENPDIQINEAFNSDEFLFDYIRGLEKSVSINHMCFEIPYYRIALRLIQFMNSYFTPKQRPFTRIMDYGCGTADYAIAFSTQNYRPCIVDVEHGPIDFAKWRLEQRGIDYDASTISEENLYPHLGNNHIVLAGEVLEHIRNPLRLVRNIHDSLPKGGFFWTSGFPIVERVVGEDHLPEAAAMRLETTDWIKSNFEPINYSKLPGFLFKK
jgi:2-polyprenyl-3-methyl-5-hydroxy-6-metoxy-1,4-benzoquinol methylase